MRPTSDEKHHWADAVAILAAVVSIGFAIWGLPLRLDDTGDNIAWIWATYAVAGGLALLGVVLAQRSDRRALLPARALLGLAGVSLIVIPVVSRGADAATWIANVLVGAAMLLAAPFIGYFVPDLPPDRSRR